MGRGWGTASLKSYIKSQLPNRRPPLGSLLACSGRRPAGAGRRRLGISIWQLDTLSGAERYLRIGFGKFLYGQERLALHGEVRGLPENEVDDALPERNVGGRTLPGDQARGGHAFALQHESPGRVEPLFAFADQFPLRGRGENQRVHGFNTRRDHPRSAAEALGGAKLDGAAAGPLLPFRDDAAGVAQ